MRSFFDLVVSRKLKEKDAMANKAKALSCNGHETNAQLARGNLAVNLSHLQDMRWMMMNALEADDPAMLAFDEGLAKLAVALTGIAALN